MMMMMVMDLDGFDVKGEISLLSLLSFVLGSLLYHEVNFLSLGVMDSVISRSIRTGWRMVNDGKEREKRKEDDRSQMGGCCSTGVMMENLKWELRAGDRGETDSRSFSLRHAFSSSLIFLSSLLLLRKGDRWKPPECRRAEEAKQHV